MIRWLWKIIVGVKKPACARECQWEIMSERDIRWRDNGGVCGTLYVLRCTTCGLLKDHKAEIL